MGNDNAAIKIGTYFTDLGVKVDLVYGHTLYRNDNHQEDIDPKWGLNPRTKSVPPVLLLLRERNNKRGIVYGSDVPINSDFLDGFDRYIKELLITEGFEQNNKKPPIFTIRQTIEKALQENWRFSRVNTSLRDIE